MNKFRILRLLSMAVIFTAYKWSMPTTKPREIPHKVTVLNNTLNDEQHTAMMKAFENIGEFATATPDSVSTKWDTFGEQYTPSPDLQCPQLYTILNTNTQQCQFSNRVEVIKHYFETGGYDGHKEKYDTIIRRLDLFTHDIPLDTCTTEFNDVFQSDAFQSSVQSICGRQNPYFRPFQLSLVLNVAGQLVAQHVDTPYFWPATRYAFPEWLLSVMQDSELFDTQRIPQVKAEVYVHDWDATSDTEEYNQFGGQFVYYPQGAEHKPAVIPATPRSAVFCDGSQMVHGTSAFRPELGTVDLDEMGDSDAVSLRFNKQDNVWQMYVNNAATDKRYSWKEIRASMVYRGWCFSDKEMMDTWDPQEWSGDWTLRDVIDIFKKD
eukprot:190618_1